MTAMQCFNPAVQLDLAILTHIHTHIPEITYQYSMYSSLFFKHHIFIPMTKMYLMISLFRVVLMQMLVIVVL